MSLFCTCAGLGGSLSWTLSLSQVGGPRLASAGEAVCRNHVAGAFKLEKNFSKRPSNDQKAFQKHKDKLFSEYLANTFEIIFGMNTLDL